MARGSTAERLEVSLDLDIRRYLEIADRYDPVLKAELQEFYESLNEVDRIVFSLKVQGYTSQEIADYLGVSRRRIRQRLKRIKILMDEYV
ncbi:MAG TPA: sigma factor-like helix-turn-helix DNA-binding protein, partial [bacterium]|nr:sigma factor-like helix-turn-helix DNA-binding protein [bacterium]